MGHQPLEQPVSRQFAKFLLTGGIAAVVNVVSRIAYDVYVSYPVAIVLAYATGMLVAFVLARRFVFTAATRTTAQAAPRFVVVNLFGLAQTWAVSMLLVRLVLPGLGVTRYAPVIAHLVGVAVPAFSSFVGHRLWSFRDDAPPRS